MAAFTEIDDAGSFYNAVLHTGNGSELAVSGVGFSPDLTWIKNRTNVDYHVLTDTVRGATKYLSSNATTAEATNAEGLKSWQSDGYTLGTQNQVNENTANFVGWNWKAGTTTGIDTTGSSITPSGYSFNQTAGFSVVAYTGNGVAGALIPHGLGVVPQYFSIHRLDDTSAWDVFHHKMHATDPAEYYFDWTSANDPNVNASRFNDTPPTAVNFCVGDSGYVNANTGTYICYSWAPKQGYSKFGAYYGNGNTDGVFIYTGFKVAYLVVKKQSGTGQNWFMFDDKRDTYNVNTNSLYIDETGAESSATRNDFLSNGFKMRETGAGENASGTYYNYIAFASNPFVNSNGVPGNSRFQT